MLGSDLHPKFGQRERERDTPIVDTNKYGSTINSVGSGFFSTYILLPIRYFLILEIMPSAGQCYIVVG